MTAAGRFWVAYAAALVAVAALAWPTPARGGLVPAPGHQCFFGPDLYRLGEAMTMTDGNRRLPGFWVTSVTYSTAAGLVWMLPAYRLSGCTA